MVALMRRDRRVVGDRPAVGDHLRKRDNLFARMLAGVNTPDFFQAL